MGSVPDEIILLTVADLAAVLRLKRQTIYNRLCNCPETLPPAMRIPTLKGPRWSARVVREWQERFEQGDLDAMPRKAGRPTKAIEIARRALRRK